MDIYTVSVNETVGPEISFKSSIMFKMYFENLVKMKTCNKITRENGDLIIHIIFYNPRPNPGFLNFNMIAIFGLIILCGRDLSYT
jgi:hypothetical protein